MYSLIKDGVSTNDIIAINPELIKYISNIEKVRQMHLENENKDEFRVLTVTYIYGLTATGKTRYVMEKEGYSSVYRATDYKHPFDSYKGEKVILFDEFTSNIRIQDMLNYLDGYPLELPCRYANKRALFTEVYIISNIPLDKQYLPIQLDYPDVWQAFLRRINKVYRMDKNGLHLENSKQGVEQCGKNKNADN